MADRIIYTRKPLGKPLGTVDSYYAYGHDAYTGPTYDVHYRNEFGTGQFNSRPMTALGVIWATNYLLDAGYMPAITVDVRLHA